MATQPGSGWQGERVASWSSSIGVFDVVYALGLWHGVLAFGLGLVLGLSLETVPAAGEVVVLDDTRPTPDRWAADEPLAAEVDAARLAEPQTVVVGPQRRRARRQRARGSRPKAGGSPIPNRGDHASAAPASMMNTG